MLDVPAVWGRLDVEQPILADRNEEEVLTRRSSTDRAQRLQRTIFRMSKSVGFRYLFCEIAEQKEGPMRLRDRPWSTS